MPYAIIQPPFTLDFKNMAKAERRGYCAWFLSQIPIRVPILEAAVRETTGFNTWRADRTRDSLVDLGSWFATQVEYRPRTQEEIDAKVTGLGFPIPIPDQELTNRTFSLAVDLGMYLAQVLQNNRPSLRWEAMIKTSKRCVDYGQPTLVGFKGEVSMNCVRIMVSLAYGVAKKNRPGDRLVELYGVWSSDVA